MPDLKLETIFQLCVSWVVKHTLLELFGEALATLTDAEGGAPPFPSAQQLAGWFSAQKIVLQNTKTAVCL